MPDNFAYQWGSPLGVKELIESDAERWSNKVINPRFQIYDGIRH